MLLCVNKEEQDQTFGHSLHSTNVGVRVDEVGLHTLDLRNLITH